jgi:hypothetical protein
MSERIRKVNTFLEAKKLGKLIQKLLPDYTDPLDFNQLKDPQAQPFKRSAAAHRVASRTMQEWMRIPITLNRIANHREAQAAAWLDLLRGTYNTLVAGPSHDTSAPTHLISSASIAPSILFQNGYNAWLGSG